MQKIGGMSGIKKQWRRGVVLVEPAAHLSRFPFNKSLIQPMRFIVAKLDTT